MNSADARCADARCALGRQGRDSPPIMRLGQAHGARIGAPNHARLRVFPPVWAPRNYLQNISQLPNATLARRGVLGSGRIMPTGSVGGPETALRHAQISRNGRGSQQVRPREVTLRSPNPPSVGMGCKVACPPRAAPVVAHADHPRGRCAVPLSARRATSTARRTGPLRSRRASPTPTTLGSHRPPRCAARANAPPPPT